MICHFIAQLSLENIIISLWVRADCWSMNHASISRSSRTDLQWSTNIGDTSPSIIPHLARSERASYTIQAGQLLLSQTKIARNYFSDNFQGATQQQRYEVTTRCLLSRVISSLLFFVLQLDLDDLHAVDVRVIPSCHVDAVQAGEVHPVWALGLPVDWPGVAPQHISYQGELEGRRNWLYHKI